MSIDSSPSPLRESSGPVALVIPKLRLASGSTMVKGSPRSVTRTLSVPGVSMLRSDDHDCFPVMAVPDESMTLSARTAGADSKAKRAHAHASTPHAPSRLRRQLPTVCCAIRGGRRLFMNTSCCDQVNGLFHPRFVVRAKNVLVVQGLPEGMRQLAGIRGLVIAPI